MGDSGLAANVLYGFLEGVERRDALAYARSFARRTLKTSERCWYAVEPLWTGYLYEVHEGGPGRSFLPDLVTELDANPGGIALVPSGRRVFELTVRNGRPVGGLLPEAKSRQVQLQMAAMRPTAKVDGRAYGLVIPPWVTPDQVRLRTIRPTRRMRRVSTPVSVPLALSAVGFAAGLGLLTTGGGLYYWSPHRVPRPQLLTVDQMPHRQWEKALATIGPDSYVSKLEYRDGRWTIETATAR
ncbi:hypothetical protein ACIU1J_24165 [Azospirillum doebereinerae]|uniref:hypothetical protein n=1 Tax=Azospirillum doebereinerae TaxID=92933 RepID=UPI001EE5CD10|nr:hypothetical protein [Azospirillum doebereinerae]MCG5242921.1 hypothetical protein [Azospirillum doebereinerae]